MRDFLKVLPLGVGLPIVIGAASVGPDDAVSNISKWLRVIGLNDLPHWLTERGADQHVITAALILAVIYAAVLWIVPKVLRRFSVRSRGRLSVIAVYGMIISALAFIGFLVAFYLQQSPKLGLTQALNSQNSDYWVKAFSDVNDDSEADKEFTTKSLTFFKMMARNNAIQAEVLLQPFVGMLLQYSGSFNNNNLNRAALGEFFTVGLTIDGGPQQGGMLIICNYPGKYKNYLARFESGEELCGIGTIVKFMAGHLVLNGCHPTDSVVLFRPFPVQLPPPTKT